MPPSARSSRRALREADASAWEKADARTRTADPFITRDRSRREGRVRLSTSGDIYPANRGNPARGSIPRETGRGHRDVPSSYPPERRRRSEFFLGTGPFAPAPAR
jgi:hypothetical protein